uniref:Trafficking protein particle complex subunit n=1 Tax=Panagrellus redivivus TaxID=6233 RepID=A0A7E4W3H7_PANRE
MSRSSKQAVPEVKTMNAELFTLTYGALVVDLLKDLESEEEVNIQLQKIGYNIGVRLADDLLSKNPHIGRCTDSHQIAEVISKQALKAYLGVTAHVSLSNMLPNEFSLILDSNPLVEFVEIPPKYSKLCYSQIICGAIHGALEALHLQVNAVLVSDVPDQTEIRVKFIRILREYMPTGDED